MFVVVVVYLRLSLVDSRECLSLLLCIFVIESVKKEK